MSLKNIVRAFARQHQIELTARKNGLIGRKGRFALGYWDYGLIQKLFVSKSFPPLDGAYESRLIIDDDLEPALKVNILYGCLEDYIAQLDKVEGDLCRGVQLLLIDSYIDCGKNKQLPENVLQHSFPIDVQDHYSDLQAILSSFYPSE